MGDLTEITSSLSVKVIGSDLTGTETYPMNVDANGYAYSVNESDGPVTPGSAASKSNLSGGQYNTSLPTLTAAQQSAMQVDANGRLISSPLNQVITGTISGSGQNVTSGPASGSIFINVTGTWSGTLEVIGGVGSSGAGLFLSQINGASALPYAYASITANGDYKVIIPSALSYLEVESASWTSGTATVTITTGNSSSIVEVNQLNQANLLATVYQGGTWVVTAANPSVTNTGNPPPAEATYIGGSVTTSAPTYTSGQIQGFSLTTAGAMRVDGSGVTQPISVASLPLPTGAATNAELITINSTLGSPFQAGGSIGNTTFASTQSGTWTVQPGNTANTTAWFVKDNSLGTVSAGTAGTQSSLAGGVFNTALPTLTTGQQVALQLDSSGRLIISPLTAVLLAEDHNYGTVGANTLRTASQIGNATGAALFGAGITTAQVLRVVLPTDQTAIPATQSGTWTTGRTWTLASGTDSVSVVQSTTPWTIQGDSASGAAKVGNPIQIGGVFNTTQPTVTTGQTVEAQATDRGALIVATGVDNFNIDNITGTVSLPTGASTSANQSTEITSLQLIDNPIGPVTPGTAGTGSSLIGAIYNTTLPTFTNGEQGAVQVDASGRFLVGSIASALPAGTNVIGGVTQSGAPWSIVGNVASGSTDSGDGVKIASVSNVNIASLPTTADGDRVDAQSDLQGRIYVTNAPTDGAKPTYSATSAIGFASATTASDIFTIIGSATTTVRIIRIGFSAQVTTAGVVNVLVVKRSSANTGGTSATATNVPNDSDNAAGTAVVKNYTANPSALGTSVGTIRSARMFIPTSGTDTTDFVNEWYFGELPGQAIVLRGIAQTLAINLNAATVTGGTWTCYVEWTEE